MICPEGKTYQLWEVFSPLLNCYWTMVINSWLSWIKSIAKKECNWIGTPNSFLRKQKRALIEFPYPLFLGKSTPGRGVLGTRRVQEQLKLRIHLAWPQVRILKYYHLCWRTYHIILLHRILYLLGWATAKSNKPNSVSPYPGQFLSGWHPAPEESAHSCPFLRNTLSRVVRKIRSGHSDEWTGTFICLSCPFYVKMVSFYWMVYNSFCKYSYCLVFNKIKCKKAFRPPM